MPLPQTKINPEDLQAIEDLKRHSMEAWLEFNKIVNEKGEKINFDKHKYLLDIYEDQSQLLVVTKAAQVGLSTLEILKNIHDAEVQKMDIIYTLPTDNDVSIFVGGKVNRIIANNPPLQKLTADKDSIEQKQIGQSMIYFRGTWTKKAAIMVTADRLVHDEKDSSKQSVVSDYKARLQHSKYKQIHVFSHPSKPNTGVDVEWQISDQKEWFINCPHCQYHQYLSWDVDNPKRMSISLELREFVCKKCGGILAWQDRAVGHWLNRYPRDAAHPYSGYHVSLLMAPDVTAAEIIEKFNDPKQTKEYFYNKVLGLPYAGSGNSVLKETILGQVKKEKNTYPGRLIIGVDTGLALRYVVGNSQGLVGYGEMTDYMPDDINGLALDQTLEYYLKKFDNSIMVIDQQGDLLGSRKLRKKYPGRVFLCHYVKDRKTKELIRWGEGKEEGNVIVDRNRSINWVIEEFRDKRIGLYNGTESDWYDYWQHWSHIYRDIERDDETGQFIEMVWKRSDRDDWVHATVYWRIGLARFGGKGRVGLVEQEAAPNSYVLNPDSSVSFDPDKMFGKQVSDAAPWWAKNNNENEEWRQ